ncbi:pseudouridine-5'-phosphate glycosidase [Clostridium sp. 'deep sea']|uniref:pseudouridine-5'-phosphate glycosidase n=1 Tax=Clostridium sp. 'deep sea' TaxID=2779445 RepID=UPI0018965EE9|nr:pseudouridine-5'-phosphate glycosidase [Clostridium sp. 'deep sea']QOR35143.1 pseudouridine-5'-phosphate glycosidase [Clostridium sp. 'deep sea']
MILEINPIVKKALDNNEPVVALESTIIAHGMPYPKNVNTALKVEQIIRDNGAIPATIGIINGVIKVGLTHSEIEFMGKSNNILKVSRRDLPFVIAKKLNGATTVASTMIAANLAGIKVFVTGGIGGVHRGASQSFDISADLQELAKTNVAVVSAGVKSILDIGLTLEYLETFGVTTVGYKTDVFPAFYTSESDYKVDYRVENAQELAYALFAKWQLGLNGGMVIGNPVPKQYEMNKQEISQVIEQALLKANELGIKGKKITPFLLDAIKQITKGKSLETNIQLVYNNAKIGAEIAVELAKLQ